MLISATSTPVIANREEIVEMAKTAEDSKKSESDEYLANLAKVIYIRYPIIFLKKFLSISALFDSGSQVNAIHPTFA